MSQNYGDPHEAEVGYAPQPEPEPKKKMNPWLIVLIVVLVLIVLCCLCTIAGMTLAGPAVGEAFDQVMQGLEMTVVP